MPAFRSAFDESEIRRVREIAASVPGWLRDDEAAFLYRSARDGPGSGAIVEIGSWKGKSTIWLASGAKAAGRERVYAVDPHTGSSEHGPGVWTLPEFRDNIQKAGVEDYVVPLVMSSQDAASQWSGPIRLLWIDGAHEEAAVRQDMEMWTPFVVEGGIVALHDTIGHFRGPKQAAAAMLRSGRFGNAGVVGITTYAHKTQAGSAWERLANELVLLKRAVLELTGRR